MMVTLLYILCIVTIVYYIYDKIILPSYRLHLRNELFSIRDKVRYIINTTKDTKQLDAAKLLHSILNNSINRLDLSTISNRVKAKIELKVNNTLRQDVANKLSILQSDKEIKALFIEAVGINENAFMTNTLLTSLWILVIITPILIVTKLIGASSKLIKRIKGIKHDRTIMLMSDKQLNELTA